MLKVSELRIGNWLLKDNNPSQLDSIQRYTNGNYYLRFADDVDRELESVTPIPVRLKHLQRAGLFPKKNDDIFEFSPSAGSLNIPSTGAPMLFGLYVRHDWITTYKYVHELQNLYFALTGQELDLRL